MRPIINPDPLTFADFAAPLLQAGARMVLLESTLAPDDKPILEGAADLREWRIQYQNAEPGTAEFLWMSCGIIYDPGECPACRVEAAEYLDEYFDSLEAMGLSEVQLQDLEARMEWLVHKLWRVGHVHEWTVYEPGMVVKSPVRWAGGKSRVAKIIAERMAPHEVYVEPFAGGASVFFAKKPSPIEVLNDLDPELANFWWVVKNLPWELVAEFSWTLISREEFRNLAVQDPTQITDLVERAYRFFYLLMAGFGGESRYPRFYISTKDGGGGNRLVGAIESLPKRIYYASSRLRFSDCQISNGTWEECVEKYDSEKTLFFLDPPYPRNQVNYAVNFRTCGEHARLASWLRSVRGKWLLTLPNTDFVRQMYEGFFFTPIEWAAGMPSDHDCAGGRYRNRDLLISNYELPEPTTPPKKVNRSSKQASR